MPKRRNGNYKYGSTTRSEADTLDQSGSGSRTLFVKGSVCIVSTEGSVGRLFIPGLNDNT